MPVPRSASCMCVFGGEVGGIVVVFGTCSEREQQHYQCWRLPQHICYPKPATPGYLEATHRFPHCPRNDWGRKHAPYTVASMHSCRYRTVCKKGDVGPRQGARAANALWATMVWPEELAFPVCFINWVADATFLYGAYCSLDVLFFSETRTESQPRLALARAHLPRDLAEAPVHPVFHDFKQRFINFNGSFWVYTPTSLLHGWGCCGRSCSP